jgi:hypothetical protein
MHANNISPNDLFFSCISSALYEENIFFVRLLFDPLHGFKDEDLNSNFSYSAEF